MSSKSKPHKSLNVKLTWQYFLRIVIIRNKHTARKVARQVKAWVYVSPEGTVWKALSPLQPLIRIHTCMFCPPINVRESAGTRWLLGMSEATPTKSHWHDFPSESWTRATPMDMSKWTGRVREASSAQEGLLAAEDAETGKSWSSLGGKSTPARRAAPDSHPFKHPQVTLYRLRGNI